MKKKNILLISLMMLMFIFSGCGNEIDETIDEVDAIKFKEEYESLNNVKNELNGKVYRTLEIDKDNSFIYKDANDIVKMMENKETFVVYFGFATCPWCRSVVPTLIEVANDLGITPIYYVDVKEIRDTMVIDEDSSIVTKVKGTDAYYELLEKMDSVLEEYTLKDQDGNKISTKEKRIYAPNIVSVVDGEALKLTDGISDKQTDGYMELTDEIKRESYEKIKCSIECIIDSKKVCSTQTKC